MILIVVIIFVMISIMIIIVILMICNRKLQVLDWSMLALFAYFRGHRKPQPSTPLQSSLKRTYQVHVRAKREPLERSLGLLPKCQD